MNEYCAVCKRPYAFTEKLMAGLTGFDTTRGYHETTEEHRKNEEREVGDDQGLTRS